MATVHKIINGDSRRMNLIPDRSVHLVVTSPPYWQLKDYGTENQIGYHQDYETYINNLNLVWKECHRALDNGCRLCINIGDQFARAVYYGRYKVIPIRTEIIRFCESIGFDYMGAIIWQKQTTTNTTGGASLMGSFPTPRNGIISIDYEFILIFRKPGKPPRVSKSVREQSKMTTREWREYFSGHWYFPGVRQEGHLAMFPEELPKRLIRMFAFIGETVLDPFLGSGTTTLAARNLERNSIGYEINPAFIEIAKRKLNIHQPDNQGTTYQFLKDDIITDINKEFENLPCRFTDFQDLDKKTDPKKLLFGSRIDGNLTQREEYFSVREVLSPECIRLNNDMVIRLIGVRAKKDKKNLAIKFLYDKTRGQKVYLRFDQQRYDDNNNLMCYVYLKNRTFLNAHLIKKGLVEPDTASDYRYREKFLGLYSPE